MLDLCELGVALLNAQIGGMHDELQWLRVVAKLGVRVRREADSGIAWVGDNEERFAAKDDHEGTDRKLTFVIESRVLDVPLDDLSLRAVVLPGNLRLTH